MKNEELLGQYCSVEGFRIDFKIVGFKGNKVMVLPLKADIDSPLLVDKSSVRPFFFKQVRKYFKV